MEHAALETWHVACRTSPPLPSPPPFVGLVRRSGGDPTFDAVASLLAFAPATVVTVSARVVASESLRRFAAALALASRGEVVSDPPEKGGAQVGVEPSVMLHAAWTALVTEARQGASALEAEKQEWRPDPADDWGDVA